MTLLLSLALLLPLVVLLVGCEKEDSADTSTGSGSVIHTEAPVPSDPEVITEANISGGAVLSAFSVSADQQVMFSRGNLQYNASSREWRFAGNQYDTIGRFNQYAAEDYRGWIDLFGWGTSTYNGCMPYATSVSAADYAAGYNEIGNTDYDWGRPNAISNGGDRSEVWRTLTFEEWDYLINRRHDAIYLRGQATVMGVEGFLLMPDVWDCPEDVHFAPDAPDRYTNTYNRSQWIRLQQLGVVFLPAAGEREGSRMVGAGHYGYYWSASAANATYAHCLNIYTNQPADMGFAYRYLGHSVRLVKDL